MNYSQRTRALSQLGDILKQVDESQPVLQKAYVLNNWFTIDMQLRSVRSWAALLTEKNIKAWLDRYKLPDRSEPKKVLIIMAGNIPLVGLHDLISVVAAGHIALVKPASDDTELVKWLIESWKGACPWLGDYITLVEERQGKNFDAVIATGSNNSNRYFEYYFSDKKRLLRKNRNSIAVIDGSETPDELDGLADDVFMYFGMGCRNVSKLLLPQGYNIESMMLAFERYKDIIHHNKYANNYTYHKAIFLMNGTQHLDNNFLLLKIDDGIASPLSVLLFQFYDNPADVDVYIEAHKNELQCVVGSAPAYVPFGKSQSPQLSDYADGVDTINFLEGL